MLMTPRDFRSVRAALVEGNAHLRSDLRLALLEKGIREPTTCRNADSFLDVAGRELLDLVVCDSGTFNGEFAPTLQRIRRNAMGGNPFVVVIATLSDSSEGEVQSALDGGVDDLLRKPAPAKRVVDRIDALVKARRPFIAMRNYVGPTRGNFAGSDVGELIDVPNTLRGKVVDKADEKALRRQVTRAAAVLKDRVAEHPLAGLERLLSGALAGQERARPDPRRQFAHLQALSREISGHYRDADVRHIANLALALAKLADRIAQRPSPALDRVEIDLLRHLRVVVRRTMGSEQRAATIVDEIAVMIDRYAGGASEPGHPATYH